MLHEAVADLLRVNARRSWCRGDPVEAGLAQSLARPGGNLTGSTFLSLEVAGKRVELLKEALLGCVRWPHYRILTIQGRSPSCRPPKQRRRASESV